MFSIAVRNGCGDCFAPLAMTGGELRRSLADGPAPAHTVSMSDDSLNCLKCPAFCCRAAGYVEVSRNDIRRLAKFLGLTVREFEVRHIVERNRKAQAHQVRLWHLSIPRRVPSLHRLRGATARLPRLCLLERGRHHRVRVRPFFQLPVGKLRANDWTANRADITKATHALQPRTARCRSSDPWDAPSSTWPTLIELVRRPASTTKPSSPGGGGGEGRGEGEGGGGGGGGGGEGGDRDGAEAGHPSRVEIGDPGEAALSGDGRKHFCLSWNVGILHDWWRANGRQCANI